VWVVRYSAGELGRPEQKPGYYYYYLRNSDLTAARSFTPLVDLAWVFSTEAEARAAVPGRPWYMSTDYEVVGVADVLLERAVARSTR
jgi:hypothetical protein